MNTLFAIFNLGGGEIILILALVLILFGAKKLPELAKGLGTGIKEFKKATRDVTDEIHNSVNEQPNYQTLPPPKRQVETPQAAPEPTVAQTTEQPKPASVPPTDKKA